MWKKHMSTQWLKPIPDSAAGSRFSKEQAHELEINGYAVLPEILSDDECDLFSRLLDESWNRSERILLENGVRFLPNALHFSPLFERFVLEPTVLAAVRSVLGPEIQLNLINGRLPDPGSGLQPLHDLARRRGRPFEKCSTIWCIDEFTEFNGAPRVLPGSHLSAEPFLSRCVDPTLPHPDEVHVVAPRGAVVVHNSHLLHGGTLNRSDRPRRSVLSAFTTSSAAANYKNKHGLQELPREIRRELSAECLQMLGLGEGPS
jgi:ectoine hydroxylase-related dioxygenase (phytanoyl-CoA dioxygenase family)